jgi:hypothetical protein
VYAKRVNHIVVDSGVQNDLRRFLLPIGHASISADRKSLRTDVTQLRCGICRSSRPTASASLRTRSCRPSSAIPVIACCPDQPLEAVADPTWGYECWGHYRQPSGGR